MRKILVVLVLLILTDLHAQKHEIGLFLGGVNGITDVGRTDYVNPFPKEYKDDSSIPSIPIVIGLIYRRNLNPHQTLRLNLDYAKIYGNDRLAVEDYRYFRGAKYSNSIMEASIVFEYNFLPINNEQERAHSPYIFAGIGAFGYNHFNYDVYHSFNTDASGAQMAPTSSTDFNTEISKDKELKFDYTIPFGVGYKYKFNYNWIIGVEVGFRPTSTDNLDGAFAEPEDFTYHIESGLLLLETFDEVINRNDELILERQLGDYSNPDWYVFTGLHLTYTFGRPPCFCD